jgi:hypothetical protein
MSYHYRFKIIPLNRLQKHMTLNRRYQAWSTGSLHAVLLLKLSARKEVKRYKHTVFECPMEYLFTVTKGKTEQHFKF